MNYSEYGNRNTYYIRILRVAYVIPRDPHSQSKHQFSEITCRPFAPFKVASSIFLPKYETLQQTKERVAAWVRATGKCSYLLLFISQLFTLFITLNGYILSYILFSQCYS